jgi:hypothetical protein
MAARAEISPARVAAYHVLRRVFEDDAYADHAFRASAKELDERDRALAQRLAFGAVQRVRTLDHAVETLGRRRVPRLDPPVQRQHSSRRAHDGVGGEGGAGQVHDRALEREVRRERLAPELREPTPISSRSVGVFHGSLRKVVGA